MQWGQDECSEAKMNAVKKELSHRFEMKNLRQLHYFLGVKVFHDWDIGVVWIGQPVYTGKTPQRYGRQNSKPISTPVNPDVKLVASKEEDDACN